MRKTILLLLLLTASFSLHAQATQTLTVNGQTIDKVVTQITFEGDNVILHFGTETAFYDMNTVVLSLSKSDATGINLMENTFSLSGLVDGNLNLQNIPENTPIVIYDTTGKSLIQTKANAISTTVDVNGLSSGIYLLKAGKQIVKFVKR